MNVPIDKDLRCIAQKIVAERKNLDEWAEVESDDMFQEGSYSGGFDADEGEFCFSYYGTDEEIWFQLSLAQMEEIAAGDTPVISGQRAE